MSRVYLKCSFYDKRELSEHLRYNGYHVVFDLDDDYLLIDCDEVAELITILEERDIGYEVEDE